MMKTAAGFRMLVVPAKMLELIRLSIDAFLTDPIPGHTNGLVSGVHEANRSGQQGYVHVREDATIAEGLATSDLGFRVTSHLLRKSLATDLAWQEGIGDTVRRRCMGPRAGDDVFGRICALEHPQIAPLVKVAANLDDQITASIGFLLTPTTRRPHWGKHSPLRQRAEHISATLTNAGWLVDPGSPDDPLCDAERVATELDIHPNTARRWMAGSTVAAIVAPDAPDAQGVPRRYSRLSAVWSQRDRRARSEFVVPAPDAERRAWQGQPSLNNPSESH
jgi:hypothetical protein